MRVLIVEDDAPLAMFVRKGLEAEHYSVDVAVNGVEAREMAYASAYDLLILDLSLPLVDGTEVLRSLRDRQASVPVLILTGRKRVEDRVAALDLGADDYLVKPFSFTELSARMRALLRRAAQKPMETMLICADLELDQMSREVKRAGKRIDLSSKEYALLELLMKNAGRPLPRSMIVENVWHMKFDTMTNVVDVYINYLRKKVDENHPLKLIHTVRGVGYQLGTMAN